jgi:hypothetical protein
MRRLPEWLFLLTVVLVGVICVAPLSDFYIEGQPDPQHVGGIISLGRVPVNWLRFAILFASALPLGGVALFAALAQRFKKPQRYWGHATIALLLVVLGL